MKVILAVMYITWAVVKIRPEKKFSALPTELTSQLGAGHDVFYWMQAMMFNWNGS